jgi:hypothetical protein
MAMLAAWLLGIGTAFGGLALTGGYYEYTYISARYSHEERDYALRELVNHRNWEPVPNTDSGPMWIVYLRRPRIRLP